MKEMKEKDKEKKPDLDFEKALADLEEVVAQLEKGGLSLNESLARFERGVRLSRFLRNELARAEKKVEILLKDDPDGVRAESFSLEEAEGGEAESPEPAKKPHPRIKKKEDDGALPF